MRIHSNFKRVSWCLFDRGVLIGSKSFYYKEGKFKSRRDTRPAMCNDIYKHLNLE